MKQIFYIFLYYLYYLCICFSLSSLLSLGSVTSNVLSPGGLTQSTPSEINLNTSVHTASTRSTRSSIMSRRSTSSSSSTTGRRFINENLVIFYYENVCWTNSTISLWSFVHEFLCQMILTTKWF